MNLDFVIADLWGNQLAGGTLDQHEAGKVDKVLNDQSTSDVTLDIYNPAGSHILPTLGRLLKVWYPPSASSGPIFVGPILSPKWSGNDETVEVGAVGIEYRLTKAFLTTPLTVANTDIGQAMWQLIARAINRTYSIGSPGLGIDQGTIQATHNINRTWDAGQNIWDALTELASLAGAPDMEFAPVDAIGSPIHCHFNAWSSMGSVYSNVIFEYNTGLDNCAEMIFEPSGDEVVTRYFVEGQTPDDGSLVAPIDVAWHQAAEDAIGIYEGYETVDATDPAVLRALAGLQVGAYHAAPNFIEVTPQYEGSESQAGGVPPRYGVDYGMADTVRAVGRKGTMNCDIAGRVMSVSIGEDEPTSAPEVKVELTIAPNVDTSGLSYAGS